MRGDGDAHGCTRPVVAATRALELAASASRSWNAGQLLEAAGILKPMSGKEATNVAMAADGLYIYILLIHIYIYIHIYGGFPLVHIYIYIYTTIRFCKK